MATVLHGWFLLGPLCSLLTIVQGKVVRGEIDTQENWAFLTRFCFLSHKGQFIYNVSYPKSFLPQNMLLYYDTKNQWPAVYKSNKTCFARESILTLKDGQILPLTKIGSELFSAGCREAKIQNETHMMCYGIRRFLSQRERWWFIAISNCNTKKGLKLTYHMEMTNDDNSLWFRHFSADEFYILHTDLIMATVYLILCVATIYEAHVLKQRHLLHHTYKLFLASVLTEFGGLLFLSLYYGLYTMDGIGDYRLKLSGKVLESTSTALFLLLLILVAKGYTVTRGRLRGITCAKIGVFMTCYVIIYAALFIYQHKYFDPGEVLYIYESPAGYGIIGLRLIAWAWFVYATVFTLIHYPNKSAFYTRLFLAYTIWLLSSPVVILISTFALAKWMREKIVNGVEIAISFEAHIIFFMLTRPSAANENFPYHVRTTQIDIMENSRNGILGNNSIDGFCLHPYAPSHLTDQPPDYATLFGAQYSTVDMLNTNSDISPTAPEADPRQEGDYITRSPDSVKDKQSRTPPITAK